MHIKQFWGFGVCVYIPKYFESSKTVFFFKQNVGIWGFALSQKKVCLKASILCVLNFNPF